MKLVYDSRIQGGQSNIYKKGNLCIKEYIGLKREEVENYLMLQSSLNGIIHKIIFDKVLKLDKKELVGINLTFPHTNTKVFYMNGFTTTDTDYIHGQTFHDVLQNNYTESDFLTVLYICDEISKYISNIRGFDMDEKFFKSQIHELNIKIINYDTNTKIMTLCITDIACTITEFLENNKTLIENIMGTK